ncbi:MAG: hypothetical protein WC379_08455 [Methanoregula sp.]
MIIIACISMAGCTQSSGTGPVTTAVPVPSFPPPELSTPDPVAVGTAVPTEAATTAPEEVVTIVHYIPLVKDVKDSALLFSLQVPVDWNPSSYRLENPENYEGFMYQTDLVKNNTFYIHTYENYRNRDQNYRDDARRWVPAPNETVVTINGITFDRFESTANGKTNVTYVARQVCMNEFGYLSVLSFSVDTSNRFAVEDYDRVVASFRYYDREKVSTMPGTEITRIIPENEGGSVRSASYSGSSSSGKAASSSSSSTCRR